MPALPLMNIYLIMAIEKATLFGFKQNRSWRRKRDSLLSSLPQNSPLDYFLPNGNTQSKDCSLLIRIPLSFFAKKREMQNCISFFWRRKRDSNPRYVYHILLPQQGSPLSLLGISPLLLKFLVNYCFTLLLFTTQNDITTLLYFCQSFFRLFVRFFSNTQKSLVIPQTFLLLFLPLF